MTAGGDRFLEHDGARLRWRVQGSGPALALLHGWALDLESWDLLAPLLAQRFTVLRMDRRGFGLSGGLPDIHLNVGDLAAVLDAAGVARVALLGMSQGARLALHFALRHPARVQALLLDGAPAIEAESELPLAQYLARLQSDGEEMLRAEILQHPLMQLQREVPAARTVLAQSVSHYRGLDLLHPVARALAPDLRQVSAPTLILNGERDSEERREAGVQLQWLIPRAAHTTLAGAGHLALLDEPAVYAAVVLQYLAALP